MWKYLKLFFAADYSVALKEDWSSRHGLDPDFAAVCGGLLLVFPPVSLVVYWAIYLSLAEMTLGNLWGILMVALCVMAGIRLLQSAKKFFDHYLQFCTLLHLNSKDTSGWEKWTLTDMACKLLSELGREVAEAKTRGVNEGDYGFGGTNVTQLAQDRLDEAYLTFSEMGVVGAVGSDRFVTAAEKQASP
jgi:hypothetical protein